MPRDWSADPPYAFQNARLKESIAHDRRPGGHCSLAKNYTVESPLAPAFNATIPIGKDGVEDLPTGTGKVI